MEDKEVQPQKAHPPISVTQSSILQFILAPGHCLSILLSLLYNTPSIDLNFVLVVDTLIAFKEKHLEKAP